jgi:hypothetical protein
MAMKKTLISLVQEVLESIDGDEVNSYSDTTESLQVANIIEATYWDIVSTVTFPSMKLPFQLDSSANVLQPTLMTLPSTNLTLEWLMYDQTIDVNFPQNFAFMKYIPLDEFLIKSYGNDQTDVNVITYNVTLNNGDTLRVLSRNDGPPTVYTTIDDSQILFDSYTSDVESTLQSAKTIAYGERLPVWNFINSFVPDLPDKQFTILRNEAKATAAAQLRQQTNSNAEKKARRGWITSQKTGRKIPNPKDPRSDQPSYGR